MGKIEGASKSLSYFHEDKWPCLSTADREHFFFRNRAFNPSLSYTLSHFVTKAQIEEADEDKWLPFEENPFASLNLYEASKNIHFEKALSNPAQKRFLDFFQLLKRFFKVPGKHILRSQNNFPMASGVASSASSFSALTLAVYEMAKEKSSMKMQWKEMDKELLAQLSRSGSGSSCRSFFSPWALWTETRVQAFKSPWNKLLHQLVVVDAKEKQISSTLAHQLIKTSPYFQGREERAKNRLQALLSSFQKKDWKSCFQICYEDFRDMHSLFETAHPSFQYKNSDSEKVLDFVKSYWEKQGEGPLVTMDAGANIHLLYRPDQVHHKEKIQDLLQDYTLLSSLLK